MFLREIAPLTILFAAAGIEFAVLNFFPGIRELIGNECHVFRTDLDALPIEFAGIIRLYEVEAGFQNIPVLVGQMIDQDLIKNGLPPVIPSLGLVLATGSIEFAAASCLAVFAGLEISDDDVIAPKLDLIGKTFQWNAIDDYAA